MWYAISCTGAVAAGAQQQPQPEQRALCCGARLGDILRQASEQQQRCARLSQSSCRQCSGLRDLNLGMCLMAMPASAAGSQQWRRDH